MRGRYALKRAKKEAAAREVPEWDLPSTVSVELVPTSDKPKKKKKGATHVTYYYVDFENVTYNCAAFLAHEDPKESKFFIYYTNKTPTVSWDFVNQLMNFQKRGHTIELIHCPAGDQACDKHILVDVACAASKSLSRDYIVISKDKGFMAPIERICEKTHANIQLRSQYVSKTVNMGDEDTEEETEYDIA